MAKRYEKRKIKHRNVIYTIVTAFLLCVIFFVMVTYLYNTAQEEAYENLHMQTKQIKDDIILQITSDRENLQTMANFAAKLYSDGEDYDLMFESFKSIGLIDNIGILNSDNTFVTKVGSVDLDGLISFEEEKLRGSYISGRIKDLTRDDYEIIRSAVPVVVDDEVVGILYGVINLNTIGDRYIKMAKEFDAQLFIYNKEDGEIIVDTVNEKLGNISFLKTRKYNDDYSYEEMMSTDKGFSSFMSIYRNENIHLHYSTIENFDWMIAMARYDSQVFANINVLSNLLLIIFLFMIGIIIIYIFILMRGERRTNAVSVCASEIRKELLETIEGHNNIFDALKEYCGFTKSNATILFDTSGDDYNYILPEYESMMLLKDDRSYFKNELFRYVAELHKINNKTVNVMSIKPDKHLVSTNPDFYNFLKKHKIAKISFAAVENHTNNITLLGTINSRDERLSRMVAEKIVVCFSMALYNKNILNKTEIAATTDALTGLFNRMSYKNDIDFLNQSELSDFSCVYVDVNELHMCNKIYGHDAGDDMLLYVANALKEVFAKHKIYRIGGDEFLVLVENTPEKTVSKNIVMFKELLEPRNYHVSVGLSYREENVNIAELVNEAEVRMYEEKALYYQQKEQKNVTELASKEYVQIKTGILEIDTMLSVMNENYNGIYRVSLDTDKAKRILMPAYLKYNENEEHFSDLFSRYVSELVNADYHREITNFAHYETIRRQLMEGKTPKIKYKKTNGEFVVLSVYRLDSGDSNASDTLWVFAKD